MAEALLGGGDDPAHHDRSGRALDRQHRPVAHGEVVAGPGHDLGAGHRQVEQAGPLGAAGAPPVGGTDDRAVEAPAHGDGSEDVAGPEAAFVCAVHRASIGTGAAHVSARRPGTVAPMSDGNPTGPPIDAAVELLAAGPMGDVELLDAVGFADADAHDVLAFLRALHDDGRVVLLSDGRAVLRSALLDGLVLWHRVVAREVDERAVELGDAALLLVGLVLGMDPVLVGEHEVALREPLDADGEPDLDRGPLVPLPEGWRTDLAAGDLVGLAVDDRRLRLVDDPPPSAGAAASDAAAEATAAVADGVRDLVAEHAVGVLGPDDDPLVVRFDEAAARRLVEAGSWSLHLDEVGSALLADRGAAVRALARPVTEALVDAGWRVDDGTVLGPGVEDESWRVHAVGRDLVVAAFPDEEIGTGLAEAAAVAWLGLPLDDGPPPDYLAALLTDPVVAEAVAGRVEDTPREEVAALVPRLELALAAAGDGSTAGAALVLSRALLGLGEVVEARDVAERAFAATGEGWEVGVELLALLRAVGGDVAGAVSAYRRLGEDGVVGLLEPFRPVPPSGVGRNDPCPCGSGRKFKQCCQRTPPPLALGARVPFLWWKLQMTAVELYGADLPRLEDEHASRHLGMLVVDALLVEDDAIADIAALLDPLLPDDERALLASWERPRRTVLEVVGRDGDLLVLRDLASGDERRVGRDAVHHAHDGDTVIAVVAPSSEALGGPAGLDHLVGSVLHLPAQARDEAVVALAGARSAQEVVDLVGDLVGRVPDAHLH